MLFRSVGGFYTIDPRQAHVIATTINAGVTLPMHYRTDTWDNAQIEKVDAFLGLIDPSGKVTARAKALALPTEARIVVMEMA